MLPKNSLSLHRNSTIVLRQRSTKADFRQKSQQNQDLNSCENKTYKASKNILLIDTSVEKFYQSANILKQQI